MTSLLSYLVGCIKYATFMCLQKNSLVLVIRGYCASVVWEVTASITIGIEALRVVCAVY